jgi:hypothetical protein
MHASGSSAGDSIIESTASHLISKSLHNLCTCKTSFGTAAVAEGIPSQEYETWVAGFENYPLDHRYYEIIHESLKDQFAHYYLFLKDANGMTRAIQPFFIYHSGPLNYDPKYHLRMDLEPLDLYVRSPCGLLNLVHRLAYNSDVAAGQLAVFQGASEAPISELIRVERATRKNSQPAAAQRVALKMGRRLRCSSVTYRFRYAPSSRLAGGPF